MRVEHGMCATLTLRWSSGYILCAHWVAWLTWNNTSFTTLHLDLRWESNCSCSSSGCSTCVWALWLVELNTTKLTWYLVHNISIITTRILESMSDNNGFEAWRALDRRCQPSAGMHRGRSNTNVHSSSCRESEGVSRTDIAKRAASQTNVRSH